MSPRELVVLGTASQVPTRHRNHNGYFLRWDREGLLFDPGEGTQRQMLMAGVSAHDLTRLCVTHFHGDHSLGLAGVIQRINLDRVPHPVTAHYPASGQHFYDRLRQSTAYRSSVRIAEHPVRFPPAARETVGSAAPETAAATAPGGGAHAAGGGAVVAGGPAGAAWSVAGDGFVLSAAPLSHPVDAVGYRLDEPDGVRMVPERLAAAGLKGPDIGRLQREGSLRGVALEDVSERRPGQSFAFVMDTRLCEGVHALAEACDMLVIESTFLDADVSLAEEHGHLTAGQAGRVAATAGVRHLVLTHFSQRYPDAAQFGREARAAGFSGELTVARDLDRIPLPARR
ncbi:MBL fold metallo-hydrolase [Streptomyces bohaiensis]|uniref:MBL fold metallo-hydrolase n=1 Tax=Streptomyces bohaiensis TaxID=1431344 RepID=UPI003B7DBEA3